MQNPSCCQKALGRRFCLAILRSHGCHISSQNTFVIADEHKKHNMQQCASSKMASKSNVMDLGHTITCDMSDLRHTSTLKRSNAGFCTEPSQTRSQ